MTSLIAEAAEHVHLTPVKIKPPKIYPTPYGGRLVWTLPGRSEMIVHLKDKSKIRHKKRWSQVMYMYYLLAYDVKKQRRPIKSENTYLLALDGDIRFQPKAVHLLVDLMNNNEDLGAACGRIHPVGTGKFPFRVFFC